MQLVFCMDKITSSQWAPNEAVMKRNPSGTDRELTDNSTSGESSLDAVYTDLCLLMDRTSFVRAPYKGILSKVACELGMKGGRRSVYKSIKVSRTIEVMIKVAEEIRAVDANRERTLSDYAVTQKGRTL